MKRGHRLFVGAVLNTGKALYFQHDTCCYLVSKVNTRILRSHLILRAAPMTATPCDPMMDGEQRVTHCHPEGGWGEPAFLALNSVHMWFLEE
ncbi:unnamed protein product [Boreogadus saida]